MSFISLHKLSFLVLQTPTDKPCLIVRVNFVSNDSKKLQNPSTYGTRKPCDFKSEGKREPTYTVTSHAFSDPHSCYFHSSEARPFLIVALSMQSKDLMFSCHARFCKLSHQYCLFRSQNIYTKLGGNVFPVSYLEKGSESVTESDDVAVDDGHFLDLFGLGQLEVTEDGRLAGWDGDLDAVLTTVGVRQDDRPSLSSFMLVLRYVEGYRAVAVYNLAVHSRLWGSSW